MTEEHGHLDILLQEICLLFSNFVVLISNPGVTEVWLLVQFIFMHSTRHHRRFRMEAVISAHALILISAVTNLNSLALCVEGESEYLNWEVHIRCRDLLLADYVINR